jgi:putative colanic acid biosynthesis UDP-glucose lipid carrier transferase
MFFIRVVTSRYFFKSKRRVAILGITPAGLAILQELHKEFSAEGIDIRFYEDRRCRDSRLINIDKAGNSRDLLALAKKVR